MTTIRLVSARTVHAIRRQSLRPDRAGNLLVSFSTPMAAREGVVVLMPARHRDTLVALLAADGWAQSIAEGVDRLYRDAPDGGPDNAPACVRRYVYDLRSITASIGVAIHRKTGPRYEIEVLP